MPGIRICSRGTRCLKERLLIWADRWAAKRESLLVWAGYRAARWSHWRGQGSAAGALSV